MNQMFIAWTPFMRRPESMQNFFGYKLHFVSLNFGYKWLKPVEYFLKFWMTITLLARKKPDVLWVQVAPTFLLYTAHLYRLLFRHKVIILADCHNSMFRKPWITLPGAVRALNRCERVIVHNSRVHLVALRAGVNEKKLAVLETKPANLETETATIVGDSAAAFLENRPCVLLPCSFDTDEPIDRVFAAARLIPDIHFVITGNPLKYTGPQNLRELPPNVALTGFLPKSVYDELVQSCDLMMGMTTRDDVQLSVANEAVGAGKPMVISGSALQRELFYDGAVYIDPLDEESIAAGCREALARMAELKEGVLRLRRERNVRWESQAMALIKTLRRNRPYDPVLAKGVFKQNEIDRFHG